MIEEIVVSTVNGGRECERFVRCCSLFLTVLQMYFCVFSHRRLLTSDCQSGMTSRDINSPIQNMSAVSVSECFSEERMSEALSALDLIPVCNTEYK